MLQEKHISFHKYRRIHSSIDNYGYWLCAWGFEHKLLAPFVSLRAAWAISKSITTAWKYEGMELKWTEQQTPANTKKA